MKLWLTRKGHRTGKRGPGKPSVAQGHHHQAQQVGQVLYGESSEGLTTATACPTVRAASTVGAPNERCEQEADGWADRDPAASGVHYTDTGTAQPLCEECEAGAASVNRIRSCQPNQHGIPGDAEDIVRAADGHAEGLLHGASVLSSLAGFSLSQDIDMSQNDVHQAYEDRFGPPPRVRDGFRDRFDRSRHADEDAARASELGSLADRLDSMAGHLSNGMNYRCRTACRNDWVLWTQSGRNYRHINVCPEFFTDGYSESQQAIGIIHELGHNRLGLDHHNANTRAQRAGNPECYASFVADIFGVSSWDSRCPRR